MAEATTAPVLSTPAENLVEHAAPPDTATAAQHTTLPDDTLRSLYEISRTAKAINSSQWHTVALQFPDHLLPDAPRVSALLETELAHIHQEQGDPRNTGTDVGSQAPGTAESPAQHKPRLYILADSSYSPCCIDEVAAAHVRADAIVHYGRACLSPTSGTVPVLWVFTKRELDLEKTLDAFTAEFPLGANTASGSAPVERQGDDGGPRVVLMADVMYQHHVLPLARALRKKGYQSVRVTEVVRNPGGTIPNRTVVSHAAIDDGATARMEDELSPGEPPRMSRGEKDVDLSSHSLFHISEPPTPLLLALASKFKSLHVLPISAQGVPSNVESATSTAQALLRRRYARVLSLASAGVIGILVAAPAISRLAIPSSRGKRSAACSGSKDNASCCGASGSSGCSKNQQSQFLPAAINEQTTGVEPPKPPSTTPASDPGTDASSRLSVVSSLSSALARAGKKSYTVVVGKINAAKLANFAEVQAWVVVGCWESALPGATGSDWDKDYYAPLATPFELRAALEGDDKRVWGGEWWGGVEGVDFEDSQAKAEDRGAEDPSGAVGGVDGTLSGGGGLGALSLGDDEGVEGEESTPPEFDLRTGRFVSNSRPMGIAAADSSVPRSEAPGMALAKKVGMEVAAIKGVASPGAEFLRSNRTWTGLGSEFGREVGEGEVVERSAVVEEGRSGIARGYTVGDELDRH